MANVSDLLGPPPPAGPGTVSSLLGPPQLPYNPSFGDGAVSSGPEQDNDVAHSSLGNVLDAVGQGVRDGWGTADLGLSPETVQALKDRGLFNDAAKGQSSLVKSFNEALFRPAAAALDALSRVPGAVIGAYQGGVSQAGKEAGVPELGRDLAALPEAFPTGELPGMAHAAPRAAPVDLAAAKAERVIGAPDPVWKGTAEPVQPVPVPLASNENLAGAPRPPEPVAPPEAAPAPEPAPTEPALVALPTDVHSAARQIAPDTFREFDELSAHQEDLRQQIAAGQDDLRRNAEAQAPGAAQIADLERRLPEATPRLAKKYQARLDALRPAYDAYMADDFTLSALTRDTPEISDLRQQLLETQYRMRDLSPDVTEAYRQAAEQFPPEPEPAVETPPPAAAGPEPEPVAEPATPEPAAATAEPAPAPIPTPPVAPVASIQGDVAQKLRAAGRPAAEADAAGQVTEALYRTRADVFDGAKGTAEELYAREAPDIQAGTQRARQPELAQSQRTGGAQGKIRLTQDGRSVITLMRTADASTYLHEMGHDWLERTVRDAADPAAPDALRQDAATIRSYLGVGDGEAIPTRAHEKFARSFERYFMEGRAPTQALAGVFGKFQAWLTSIYKTVAKLRAPITPDIRDVFDRLLAREPNRAAVVPELPEEAPAALKEPASLTLDRVTSNLADLHEQDLKTTEPADAAAVADQVKTEVDRTAAEHAPEAAHAAADPASRAEPAAAEPGASGELGGRATPSGDLSSDGGEAGPDAGAGSSADQPGPINEGGSGAAANGPGPSRGAELPAGPAQRFGPADDGLVDKAGNIRLDNLNQPEDVNQVIRDTAAQNDDFTDARRGVVSDAQVIDLADALGMTPADLGRRQIGQAFNAEQIVAARKMLVQSAQAVRDAAIKAAAGSDADVMAYAEARARHLMIQEQVSGITAEAGRALRAFRNLGDGGMVEGVNALLQGATGKTLFQLRREAKAGALLDTPGQVSKFVADSAKPTFGDMAMEYWINGLISGPATHTTYAIGNALLALWKAGPETGVAAGIGKARALFGDTGERVYGGEVGAGLYAILKGQRDGVRAAWKAAKTGLTTELPGEGEAGAQASVLAMQPRPLGAIPGPVGTVIRLPSRGVAVIHSYFRAIGYEQGLAQLAYRQAATEGLASDAFSVRVADLTTNPPPDMMAAAREQATTQTLMGAGGEFTQRVADLTNTKLLGVPLLKIVDPFVKIGSNVMKQALLERSPLGVLDPEIRSNLMGRNGAIARDQQIARIAVGSSLGAVSVGLAAQGLLTGGGPSDPREAAVWRMTGRQPYSVRVGDTWYEMHRLGPLAMVMGVAADMHEYADAMETHDASHLASLLVGSITKGLLNESFMRGPAELIQALEDPDRYGARYVQSQLTTLLPFSTAESQIARAMDPYARQARTLMDAFKAKVPGLSETLMPRRDIWGEPLPNKDDLGMDGLTSIAESRVNNDPVNQALLRLHIYPAPPEHKITGVDLTDQQYDDYSRLAGRMAKMRLNAVVGQQGFDLLPPGVQTRVITETMTSSRRAAGELVKMQNPGIIQAAMQARRDMLTQGRPER